MCNTNRTVIDGPFEAIQAYDNVYKKVKAWNAIVSAQKLMLISTDGLKFSGIVGTLAGDETVFVATKNPSNPNFANRKTFNPLKRCLD